MQLYRFHPEVSELLYYAQLVWISPHVEASTCCSWWCVFWIPGAAVLWCAVSIPVVAEALPNWKALQLSVRKSWHGLLIVLLDQPEFRDEMSLGMKWPWHEPSSSFVTGFNLNKYVSSLSMIWLPCLLKYPDRQIEKNFSGQAQDCSGNTNTEFLKGMHYELGVHSVKNKSFVQCRTLKELWQQMERLWSHNPDHRYKSFKSKLRISVKLKSFGIVDWNQNLIETQHYFCTQPTCEQFFINAGAKETTAPRRLVCAARIGCHGPDWSWMAATPMV